ncbi:MAG: carboxymuconolactone decarboxylase family protein [Methanothrix sp.]|jgi:AhpD family alkylhydroperoxidase
MSEGLSTKMSVEKPRADRFIEAMGEGVEQAFQKLAGEILKEGALSAKDKSLIALACSVALRCEHCTKRHLESARRAGAGREEILEAAGVAALVRMGSGLNTAAVLLDEMQE